MSPPALVSGQATMAITGVLPLAGMAKAGKLRVLAYTGERRSTGFPDVPTVAEAGLPGAEVVTPVGIEAPAGTPMGIVRTLQDVIVEMVKKPDIRERLATIDVEAVGNTSEEFARAITADPKRWGGVVERANIQPD